MKNRFSFNALNVLAKLGDCSVMNSKHRFRALATQGNVTQGLALLDKLDKHFSSK